MTYQPPVIFEERAGGRVVAVLGTIEVGEIRPHHLRRGITAYWVLNLPFCSSMHTAADVKAGKKAMAQAIASWIEAAGLKPVHAGHPLFFRSAKPEARP